MEAITTSIVDKIIGCIVDPIKKQFGYLIFLNSNVESLKEKMEKLENERFGVQRRVEAATRNVEEIDPAITAWLTRVDEVKNAGQQIILDKDQFRKGCFNGWFLNLKPRYIISRKAKKKTQEIVELQQEKKPKDVSFPKALKPLVGSASTQTFGSRESIINDVIMNLKDEKVNIIGICGMGGVGKTTIMEEVFKRVKEEKIFDDYAQTVVSEKEDPIRIQSDVAEMLGLKFEENNSYLRARKLSERLEGKKVLILLDDVWKEIDLQALGITLEEGQKRCKILYTSRNRHLWVERQNKKRDVPLDVLLNNEAWDLFREKVGNFLDEKAELQPLAKKIVKECAGLPLALVTLGRALIGKSINAWNDTLLKLMIVSGAQQKVHESLKLSYDYLDDEEAKSLFLLCGLFREDSEITVESLVDMGMGLQLFKGTYSVDATRDRVIALAEHLNSCCLVSSVQSNNRQTGGHGDKFIKIHDLVRDVSKLIASTEKGALVVEPGVPLGGSQEQVMLGNPLWLSVISIITDELLPRLKCSRLELLHCKVDYGQQLPDSLFEGLTNLQVVDINYSIRQKCPSSLQVLTRLRTLSLINCDCGDLTAIGNLKSLEILRIADGSIKTLPKEIGHLSNLMLLDVHLCYNLRKISDGVISSLIRLEELYLGMDEIDWGTEEEEKITKVRQRALRILHCKIEDPSMIQRFPLLFCNLKKYCIVIGNLGMVPTDETFRNYDRVLSIYFETTSSYVPLKKELSFLVQNTEVLFLQGKFTKDLAHDFIREGSQVIKHLELFDIDIPQYSYNTIRPLEAGSFAKLKNLNIGYCEQMTNVFQLGSTKLEFPKLKTLDVVYMPSLISFCSRATEIEFHCLTYFRLINLPMVECLFLNPSDQSSFDSGEDPSQSFFPRKVSFPSVVEIDISGLENMKEIWGAQLQSGSFYNLVKLSVDECPSLQKLFTLCIATYLVELQTLSLRNCSKLKEVVSKEEEQGEKNTANIFPKLKYVYLDDMPALEIFCHVEHDLEFSMLEKVRISKCPKLKTFAPGFVNTPNLYDVKFYHILLAYEETLWKGNLNGTIEHLHECGIKSMELNDVDTLFILSTLESLSLADVNNLQCITYGPLKAGSFENLRNINIKNCKQLTNVFQLSSTPGSTELKFPSLKKLEIENLPCLISFSNGATEVEFHCLESLRLTGLPKVECLVSKPSDHSDLEEDPSRSMFPHKVSFPSVAELDIFGLGNMKDIWGGQLQAGSFYNLAKLSVCWCPSLQKLFTPRIATYLVELQRLILSGCSKLKEVISEEEEEEEKSTTNIFPKLREVELKNMPALERFCHVEHDLEFSMLQKVRIFKCPKIKTFTSGIVNTPNLDGRMLYSKEYGDISPKDNLNATIQHLHEHVSNPLPENYINYQWKT